MSENPKVVLINPPVVKPSEPPAGIAKLAGCLKANNISYQVIDANAEGIHFLLGQTEVENEWPDKWSRRVCENLETNIAALRNIETYKNKSRYSRAAQDVNRVLQLAGKPYGVNLTLSDFTNNMLTPVKSADLLRAAQMPDNNPFYPYFSARLLGLFQEDPDYIGFSVNYLSQALCAFAMIGFIKNFNPRLKIVLGGSLVTSWAALGMRKDKFAGLVDEMIAGAGEEKLLELLGVENKKINCAPDYDDFSARLYLSPGFILPYSASRGCYWRGCAFCPERAEVNPYLPLSLAQVNQELAQLLEKYQPVLVHFLDNALSPAMLKNLAQYPPGAPWYGFARISNELADEDFCLALKKSGCVMLKLGIESGDQDVLDKLNKGINLTDASAALLSLKKAGIAVYVYLLFGTPQEFEANARKTMDFTVAHSDCIAFLNLAIFNLPIASAEAQNLQTDKFYEGDLSLYSSFHHPAGWDRQAARNFLEKTFKKHPAVAPIIRRMPEFFTSNHAPFFSMQS
ncbi:MAG TPA: radical SAM protein [Smithellaceae bacterium]|nr:radical SAM protein [Smithellaceae bacterium]HRS88458.1 radical SAM protein [Smithellaceae bacterium]HRV25514.1 radical SAM protein [Smithellaceae bacterium]